MTKRTIPVPEEYQTVVLPSGLVKWQHRTGPELGESIYDRTYSNIIELENDICDKYGKRFANAVIADIKAQGKSSNRVK